MENAPDVQQVMMLPAVGNLTDDDGDGTISEQDTPDIVAIAFNGDDGLSAETFGGVPDASLVLLSGTGEEHWSLNGFYWKGGPAIADINQDGHVSGMDLAFILGYFGGATDATTAP